MSQKYKRTHLQPPAHSYRSASSRIRFTLTNDYMFKIIFQKTHILSGFLCALSYLCRSFDRLYHGEDYSSTKRALHIGILDFPLFPDCPEFYAAYRLMNLKDHQIINDKFQLNVLELNEIHLATEEDRQRGLDRWAALFKANTWREIKMLATHDKSFENIAQELYQANADDRIRRECEAREEFYFEQRRQQKRLLDLERDNSAKDQTISSLETEIARLREKLSALGLDNE